MSSSVYGLSMGWTRDRLLCLSLQWINLIKISSIVCNIVNGLLNWQIDTHAMLGVSSPYAFNGIEALLSLH